jgi:hypothetical protein
MSAAFEVGTDHASKNTFCPRPDPDNRAIERLQQDSRRAAIARDVRHPGVFSAAGLAHILTTAG